LTWYKISEEIKDVNGKLMKMQLMFTANAPASTIFPG